MGHDNVHMYTQIKTCPVCSKKFVASVSDWAYAIRLGIHKPKFFCSWSCLQKYRKEKPNAEKDTIVSD